MLYKLGDIIFEFKNGPSSLTRSEGINIVEKERLDGKPLLEKVGGTLTRIEMQIRLHWSMQNVQTAVNAFRSAMLKGEPLTLIRGSGFSEGDFVITNFDQTVEKTDSEGRLMIVEATIRLLEYVVDQVESTDALAARKKAFATIEAKPILINPKPQFQTPQSMVMRDITLSASSAKSASEKLKKASVIPVLAKSYMDQAQRGLARAKAYSQQAKDGVDSVASKISNANTLKSNIDSVISSIDSITTNFTKANLPNIRTLAFAMDTNVASLMAAASQLSNVTALRK